MNTARAQGAVEVDGSVKEAPGATILVVDDEDEIREVLRDVLMEEGYHVICARNGREALTQLQRMRAPSLILLDLMMPVMNGWELCTVLSHDATLSTIPVIVLSAAPRAMCQADELRVVASLPKPPGLDLLLSTVARYCTPSLLA